MKAMPLLERSASTAPLMGNATWISKFWMASTSLSGEPYGTNKKASFGNKPLIGIGKCEKENENKKSDCLSPQQ